MIRFSLLGRAQTWKRTASITTKAGALIRLTPKMMRASKKSLALACLARRPRGWQTRARYALHVHVVMRDRAAEGDVDNYGKLVMDALETIAWDNDRLIDLLVVSKAVGTEPRTEVAIAAIEETAFGVLMNRVHEFVGSWDRKEAA